MLETQQQLDEALIDAAKNGDLEALKKAHKQGANIHAKDNTPVVQAAYEGHLDVLRYLVEEHKANIYKSEKAIRLALKGQHIEVAYYLAQQGANYKAITDRFFTLYPWPENKLKTLFSIGFMCNHLEVSTHFWRILSKNQKTDNLRQQFRMNSFIALQKLRGKKPRRLVQPQQKKTGTAPS